MMIRGSPRSLGGINSNSCPLRLGGTRNYQPYPLGVMTLMLSGGTQITPSIGIGRDSGHGLAAEILNDP